MVIIYQMNRVQKIMERCKTSKLIELVLMTAIEEAGEIEDVRLSKENAEELLKIVREHYKN